MLGIVWRVQALLDKPAPAAPTYASQDPVNNADPDGRTSRPVVRWRAGSGLAAYCVIESQITNDYARMADNEYLAYRFRFGCGNFPGEGREDQTGGCAGDSANCGAAGTILTRYKVSLTYTVRHTVRRFSDQREWSRDYTFKQARTFGRPRLHGGIRFGRWKNDTLALASCSVEADEKMLTIDFTKTSTAVVVTKKYNSNKPIVDSSGTYLGDGELLERKRC